MWSAYGNLLAVIEGIGILVTAGLGIAAWLQKRAKEKLGKRGGRSYVRMFRYSMVGLVVSIAALVATILMFTVFAPKPRLAVPEGCEGLVTAANVSRGEQVWRAHLGGQSRATVGDTVAFKVTVYNGVPHTTAEDTTVRVLFPWNEGRELKMLGVAACRNGGIVEGTCTVDMTTPGRLSYVRGSTKLFYGGRDQQCLDGVVSDPGISVGKINDTANAAYATSVIFLARVDAPTVMAVDTYGAVWGSRKWAPIVQDLHEGDRVSWKLALANHGAEALHNVLIRDTLPPRLVYWPGTTTFYSPDTRANGLLMPDGITAGGLILKELKPGKENVAYMTFETTIDHGLAYGSGNRSELVSWVSMQAGESIVEDEAKVTVLRDSGRVGSGGVD